MVGIRTNKSSAKSWRLRPNRIDEEKNMSTRVLVAIDRTGLSQLVLDSLSAQMQPNRTEILLLQVVEPLIFLVPSEMSPGYAPEMVERQREMLEEAKSMLSQAAEMLRTAGFAVNSSVVEGEIKEGIITVAAEWKADIIVVTSHARTGVSKFLHRSVAQDVVRRAPCSVLVLKEIVRKQAA
jgi:nucleotide-binding universal stress UspA family protein